MLQLLHWKGPAGLEVHHQAPSGLVGRGEPADDARGGRRFDLGRAAQSAGWQRELLGGGVHAPEAEALGITSFVFRAPRPFQQIAQALRAADQFSFARFTVPGPGLSHESLYPRCNSS